MIKERLGNLIHPITDYHANGSYKVLKENVTLKDTEDYALMIRTTNFEQDNFKTANKFIDKHAYEYLKKSQVLPGDIIMNKIANAGSVYLMPDLYRPVSLAMNLFLIRPDSEKVNPLYIYLFLKQNEKYVKSFAQGSVTLTITKDAVRNLEILLPERNIQDEVVNIYEIFASKIELNKKMNETLERIRETLFKSWFIDFDPVRAKAEGRPTGLSKEICDLFPDSFEDSESGEIPKGWKLSTLSEIFDIQGGSQPPAKTFIVKEKEGYIRLLQIRDYDSSDHVTYIPAKKNLRIVDEDEVLIGRYGSGNGKFMEDSLGRPLRGLSGAINVAIVRTIPKIENSREFIAIMASSGLFYRLIVGGSARAVQAGFKKEDLDYINFPVPSPEILLVFEEFGALVWKRIKALREENRTISELRDTLLPKLISGELKIPEAENLVKEAGI